MCSSKQRFKCDFRHCKRNRQNIIADLLGEKLLAGDCKNFWKDVRSLEGKGQVTQTIDGVSGTTAICDKWHAIYTDVFNQVPKDAAVECDLDAIACDKDSALFSVSPCDVEAAIRKLKMGKSAGPDALSAEHVRFAGANLHQHLSALFTAMLQFSYMPRSMIVSYISPVLKDKNSDVTFSRNYRPITVSNVLSKLFELIIFPYLKNACPLSDSQFGFRDGSSTDAAIYLLKEVIRNYNRLNSRVYCTFLDASKAFDRVNHSKLFSVLSSRGVSPNVIRVLRFWYSQQTSYVKWGNQSSPPFSITNGVRQGSLLSPLLFNIYMYELSQRLSRVSCGCIMASSIVNHIFYVDDIVLLSPAIPGLRNLLSCCESFANEFDIIFNPSKSHAVEFHGDLKSLGTLPKLVLNNSSLSFVTVVKYLGVYLTHDLSDVFDMLSKLRGFYANSNALSRKFSFCSTDVKKRLFSAYCSQIYGCSLWVKFPLYVVRRFRVAYSNAVRKLFNLPYVCSVTNTFPYVNVTTFDALLRFSRGNLRRRMFESRLALIIELNSSDILMTSQLHALFRNSLFTFNT